MSPASDLSEISTSPRSHWYGLDTVALAVVQKGPVDAIAAQADATQMLCVIPATILIAIAVVGLRPLQLGVTAEVGLREADSHDAEGALVRMEGPDRDAVTRFGPTHHDYLIGRSAQQGPGFHEGGWYQGDSG